MSDLDRQPPFRYPLEDVSEHVESVTTTPDTETSRPPRGRVQHLLGTTAVTRWATGALIAAGGFGLFVAGEGVRDVYHYYFSADTGASVSASYTPKPSAEATRSQWQDQADQLEASELTGEKLAQAWQEAFSKSPIKAVPFSEITHITIDSPAHTVDELPSSDLQAMYPDGTPAIHLSVDVGTFDGTPTSDTIADPADPSEQVAVYKLHPPTDNKAYAYDVPGRLSGILGVNLSTVDTSRSVYDFTSEASVTQPNQAVQIYGHSSSRPNESMSLQGLQYVMPGSTVTIKTGTGTLEFVVSNWQDPSKSIYDTPAIVTPAIGSVEVIACKDDKNAGKSTKGIILTLTLVSSTPEQTGIANTASPQAYNKATDNPAPASSASVPSTSENTSPRKLRNIS